MKNLFPSDPAAFLQCTLEIILYITYYLILIHEGCALKMMVQASEIQINTAHHGLRIITGKYLGMYKSGPELVDLHSCIHQFQIIRVCQKECIFLIRDIRHDDLQFVLPLKATSEEINENK